MLTGQTSTCYTALADLKNLHKLIEIKLFGDILNKDYSIMYHACMASYTHFNRQTVIETVSEKLSTQSKTLALSLHLQTI